MAIRLKTQRTERVLFCGSKWWGDPDLPENMQYPTISVEEDGEKYDYPLTFICQINCEDLAPFDHQDKLPHEGMLYFFGAVDQLIGYESPIPTPIGEWPKGHLVVKYAKSINFETFQSCILVDDDGNSLTDPELEICFEECEDEADGIKILGVAADAENRSEFSDMINLIQIDEDESAGFRCENWKRLNVFFKESDLKFGNWKKSRTVLTV